MKLIKPSFEILESQGLFKDIELAARTCYKSEDRITEYSANKMVEMLIKNKHTAMLEHGTVYLTFPCFNENNEDSIGLLNIRNSYNRNKYSTVNMYDRYACVTTNYRVLIENDWLDNLEYQCEPTEFHEKRIGVKFVCDRGVSHEFVRHRTFSFAQESTRYCNYSKNKFGSDLTFIAPEWLIDWDIEAINKNDWENCDEDARQYADLLQKSQETYMFLLDCPNKWSPQEARSVLPNSLKTELVMTGFMSDWKHFFELRDAKTAHPQAYELAHPLHEKFKELNLV